MTSGIAERVQRVDRLRQRAVQSAPQKVATLHAGLRDIAAIRSWASAAEATIVRELEAASPFPEATIAEAARCSVTAASKARERRGTLDAAPLFGEALTSGSIVTGHVDELTRAAKKLDDNNQRNELFDRTDTLLASAEGSTIEQFRKTLGREVKSIQRDDGMARLERQRRATTLNTWVDDDGMWNLRAKFDPLTGLRLGKRIDATLAAVFAESTPSSCPADPLEKQKHLRALSLARLLDSTVAGSATPITRSGTPEFVAVIDVDQPNGAGEPTVDWGIDVDIPLQVIANMLNAGSANITPVVVRNGVVIHAAGQLDLGRSARHANRAQRRALRSLYATCAVPGCSTHFDRCKIHHIIWWSRGGRTDLANLLPVCVHHHHKIHDAGWNIAIDSSRRLTITMPDGTVMTTGPPSRLAG